MVSLFLQLWGGREKLISCSLSAGAKRGAELRLGLLGLGSEAGETPGTGHRSDWGRGVSFTAVRVKSRPGPGCLYGAHRFGETGVRAEATLEGVFAEGGWGESVCFQRKS